MYSLVVERSNRVAMTNRKPKAAKLMKNVYFAKTAGRFISHHCAAQCADNRRGTEKITTKNRTSCNYGEIKVVLMILINVRKRVYEP